MPERLMPEKRSWEKTVPLDKSIPPPTIYQDVQEFPKNKNPTIPLIGSSSLVRSLVGCVKGLR